MADWINLPFDLLRDILMRLATIEDFVYFSVVCRLWNHVASLVKHEFRVETTPWLLLAENTKDNPECLRKVLNPYNNKCYHLKLPEISGCRCWGSEYGWVVTYRDFELHLFNPLTKERLSLPHQSCLPCKVNYVYIEEMCKKAGEDEGLEEGGVRNLEDGYEGFEEGWYEEDDEEGWHEEGCGEEDNGKGLCFIKKAYVFEVAPHDLIVLVAYFANGRKLAFARPGDQLWTAIQHPRLMLQYEESYMVADVVVHGAKLLILYEDLSVGYIDISDFKDPRKLTAIDYEEDPEIWSDPQSLCLKAREYVPAYPSMLRGFNRGIEGLYLAHSCSDLFLVLRNRFDWGNYDEDPDKNDYQYRTLWFLVCRLGLDAKTWSQVPDLGDVVLFLGNNSTMSVPASAAGKCASRCIYFTDDVSHYWELTGYGGNDLGVFKLGNSEPADIYNGSDRRSREQTPLWFVPRL